MQPAEKTIMRMVVTKITKANKKYLAINFIIEKENDSDTRAIEPCKEGNLPIMSCHLLNCYCVIDQ
ncbi:hypothetical protein NC653_015827 [Populus alba x Populus x berolinensis]|uniref:Uncharacterized protein n=1 Tax=Populus alba x Populus x berolinensis TaxID=444605 RepID=A0AAD6VYI5_9ROSI|nr:hypothetical protein NC653_015827 [Populus alba x Populus x berolinensis]